MPKKSLTSFEIEKIKKLRETGHSLPEIKKLTKHSNSTVAKYIKGVSILPEYREIWRIKQGGSRARAEEKWKRSHLKAEKLLPVLTDREKLIILACLYWSEGNKTELNIINSDPALIKSFVLCSKLIGVKESDLKLSIRLYEDINIEKAKKNWAKILNLPVSQIRSVNILKGKKVGKLEYGMCRVRVTKGERHFKLIMSMIDLIKSHLLSP
jgi:DNA-binding transcriptional MerR regulator